MMRPLTSALITQTRIAKWLMKSQPITKETVWTETRLAIEFDGHLYLLSNGQVFQCAHCGHYDPEVSAASVKEFFFDYFGIKPVEIEVTVRITE